MEAYLTKTCENLRSGDYNNLNIVMGNESCDLDSAVCALAYGAFLNWQYMQIKCKVCTRVHRDNRTYKDDLFIPLMNVDRDDYELKTEVAYALGKHGIDASKLIFRNDYDIKHLISTVKTNVTLVDHHVLAKRDRFLTSYVTEIIDHRPIDNTGWRFAEETRSTIITTGSCCTLVAQRMRNLGALLAKDVDFFNAYPAATDLLHSCIILDTVNFSKQVNKASSHDLEIVEFLESVLKPDNVEEYRKSKLDNLVDARRDVSTLNAAQLLRKDFKVFGDVLVPSFPILVEEFLNKPQSMKAVSDALQRHNCNIALLLGMNLSSDMQRDVAIYSPNVNESTQLAMRLRESTQPSLNLTQQLTPHTDLIYFKQMNLTASRKQYIPLIKQHRLKTSTSSSKGNK